MQFSCQFLCARQGQDELTQAMPGALLLIESWLSHPPTKQTAPKYLAQMEGKESEGCGPVWHS